MAFATVADVETRLDRDLDVSEEARAELLLEEATDLIMALTGQLIVEASETIVLRGCRRVLVLPQIPVTAVASVVVDGATYPATRYDWTEGGLLTLRGCTWPRLVSVTYTHGYADVPGPLIRLCAKLATDIMAQRPARVTSERIGDYAVSMSLDASMLSADDHRILDQYAQVFVP